MNKNNAVVTQQKAISDNADRICKLNELGLKKDILSQAFRLKIASDFAHHKVGDNNYSTFEEYLQDKFGIDKGNAYHLISVAEVVWDKLIDDPQMETILEPELLTAVRANRTEILPIQAKNDGKSYMYDFLAEEVISFINATDKVKLYNLVRIGQDKFYELIANKEISLGNGNILKIEDVKRDRAVFMQILKPFLPAKTTKEKEPKQLTRNDCETLKKNHDVYWLNFLSAIKLFITTDAINTEFERRAEDLVQWVNKEIFHNK